MVGNKFGHPPAGDEVEVSLFGPGYGESILLHLGRNDWVIVDSCLTKDKAPAPIEYLKALGLPPSEVVKLVVATHWHDDHVGGLGSILGETQSATFVCSEALKAEEFLTLVRAYNFRAMMTSPGVKEFNTIIDILNRRTQNRQKMGTPTWAIANRPIWKRPIGGDSPFQVEVVSLSPSDASVTLAKHEIASLIPQEGDSKTRVAPRPPNHTAVVLWVKAGNSSILLGSDLEVTSEPSTGWIAILDSLLRPEGKASVFKVAHHGSKTAHEERIWTEMLLSQPAIVLTPFVRGKVTLPTKADAQRMCRQSPKSYCTANIRRKEKKNRPQIVTKTIREVVKSIHEVPASTGMIRLRKNGLAQDPAEWNVQLFGTALGLSELC